MRRLVAALACRAQGSRLYGKPLQNLDVERGVTILGHLVSLLRSVTAIDAIVLGVSEGAANVPFVEFAEQADVDHILGDPEDVLQRLIQCGRRAGATDVFRVTTESPFCYYEAIDDAWRRHVADGHDVTVIDGVPEGSHFEIFTLAALERSHTCGDRRHRSEFCNLYVREHRDEFRVGIIPVPPAVARTDLRLTVDQPHDLIVCREVYAHLRNRAPRLPLAEIVAFLDARPELKNLVAPFVPNRRIWS